MVEASVREGLVSCLLKWKPVSELMVPPMTVSKGGGFRPGGEKSSVGVEGHFDPPVGQANPQHYGPSKMGPI